MKPLLLVLLTLILSFGWLFWDYQTSLNQAVNPSPVIVDIAPGASLAQISLQLDQVLEKFNPVWFQLYARQSKQGRRLKSGEYEIPTGATPRDILALLVSGKVRQHKITIPEGWTFAQFYRLLTQHPAVELTLPAQPDQVRILALDHPEGWFFPDTYYFAKGTTDVAILTMAHQRMKDVLNKEWQQKMADLPIESPYQALILASIIEKETGVAEERGRIAGVFVRRLKRGMRLQTDPTVIYGLGAGFDGNLTREHLRQNGAYNTYVINGLPPTPIALPGQAAIHAALNPEPGDSLYFVATGDGRHVFSDSLVQHNQAVRRYQLSQKKHESR